MFANMAAALIKHEQIVTTLPKAKELRPVVEKLSRSASAATCMPAARRSRRCATSPWSKKLFDVLGPRYKDRNGGYTRVLKAGFRYGDSRAVAVIEFVDRDVDAKGLGLPARCCDEKAHAAKEARGRPLRERPSGCS